MSLILYYGSAALAGLLLAGGLTWWAVGRGMRGAVRCGAWRHYPGYGSSTASPYVRAQSQLAGPLAVDRREAIYFIADCDDRGETLRPGRDYRIEGGDLAARWWSVTVYGDDHHLVPNPLERYSYNSDSIAKNADGSWTIRLSGRQQPGNWIPTGHGRRLEFCLRMYNPAPSVLADVSSLAMPRILAEE